jgi:hypothetical protein
MKRFSAAVSFAVLIWTSVGCGRSSNPTSPSALPTPTRPTSSLSGLVFAETPSGLVPVDGARVRLEIGSFRLDTTTDQNGLYTLSGLYDGNSSITTSKDGYDTDTRNVTIAGGGARLDIRVVRRVAHTMSGVIFEITPAGRVPVDGVYVTGGWDYPVTTDSNGFFSISVCGDSACLFYNGDRFNVYVSKDGYQPDTRDVTINGDTRLEIQLVRR